MKQISKHCELQETLLAGGNTTGNFPDTQSAPTLIGDQKRKFDTALQGDDGHSQESSAHDNDETLGSAERATAPQSAPILGPLPKKKTLIQSQAERLRSGPSATLDRSRNTLFPAIRGQITKDDSTSPETISDPAHASSSATLSDAALSANPRATTSTARQNLTSLLSRGRRSGQREKTINGLRVFERDVEIEVIERFTELQKLLEPALVKFLQDKRLQFRPLSLQILFLGDNEDVAEPWIVVNCPKKAMRKVDKFLQEDVIKNMCHGPLSCRVRFRAAVGGPLTLAGSDTLDEVFIEGNEFGEQRAGTRQIRVMQSGVFHYATLGGYVRVIDAHGKNTYYGLTAGHVLPNETFDSGNDDIHGDGDSEDHEYEDEEKEDCSAWSSIDESGDDVASTSSVIGEHDNSEDYSSEDSRDSQFDRSWEELGFMYKASYSRRARDRDWALVELGFPRDLQVAIDSSSSSRTSEPARPSLDQAALVGNRSELTCKVSAAPARVLLPSGNQFVDVNVVRMNDGQVVRKGSSGSWIVNREEQDSTKVFGTLVATDTIGDLWMIPMMDILQDIQDELGALEIYLTGPAESNTSDSGTAQDKQSRGLDVFVSPKDIDPSAIIETTTDAVRQSYQETTIASSKDEEREVPLSFESRSKAWKINNSSVPSGAKVTGSSDDYHPPPEEGPHIYFNTGWGEDKGHEAWCCGSCGDGPYLAWQYSCQSCGHNGGH